MTLSVCGPAAPPCPEAHSAAGGDDTTSWRYNGLIYESDITRGLITWNLGSPAVADALRLDHLNPQTIEFMLD